MTRCEGLATGIMTAQVEGVVFGLTRTNAARRVRVSFSKDRPI